MATHVRKRLPDGTILTPATLPERRNGTTLGQLRQKRMPPRRGRSPARPTISPTPPTDHRVPGRERHRPGFSSLLEDPTMTDPSPGTGAGPAMRAKCRSEPEHSSRARGRFDRAETPRRHRLPARATRRAQSLQGRRLAPRPAAPPAASASTIARPGIAPHGTATWPRLHGSSRITCPRCCG